MSAGAFDLRAPLRLGPFVPNEGWPQKVFRYDLKFHIVSLHIPDAQRKSLEELLSVPNGKFASVVPAGYGDAFMNKLDSNLFSPTELQIILSGDMEVQRVKRKTLDAYEALMVSVRSEAYRSVSFFNA